MVGDPDMLLNFLIFSILSYWFLLRPLQRNFARVRESDFATEYYLFQLKQVRKHYPVLQELSYEEIHERYDVRQSYDSIR